MKPIVQEPAGREILTAVIHREPRLIGVCWPWLRCMKKWMNGQASRISQGSGKNAIAFPHPTYSTTEYIVTSADPCGPHEVEEQRTTTGNPPEVITRTAGPWYRGAACIWLGDRLEVEDCHGYCRYWSIECVGPPEPCGDQDDG